MDEIATDFENWGAYQMKQFHIMYEKGERCDLEISCNKQIFLVHRLILSACSEYVRELGDKQHIILPDEVSCKALKSVIEFVYTGKISFCKDDKQDYLLVSSLLNMRLLTELIKMEESCSFTLSMEDENEDSKSSDNQDTIVNWCDVNSSYVNESSSASTSKKTEKKSPKSSRSSVFPPMFRFPYLQNKLNMNRTYGLITTLTESIPSRFEISEEVLQKCEYQSTFEDVTYDTDALFVSLDFFPILQKHHRDFVRKHRETGTTKRMVNVLFSFFDKYTPAYSTNTDLCSRKREIAASFSCSPQTPVPPKRNLPRCMTFSIYENAKTIQTRESRRKSVTFADKPEILGEKLPSLPSSQQASSPPSLQLSSTTTSVSSPVSSMMEVTPSMDTRNSFDAFAENDIEMSLPAPLTPVQNITGEVLPDGQKVELIKLNNVVTSTLQTSTNYREIENDREHSNILIPVLRNDDSNEDINSSHPQNDRIMETNTSNCELANVENVTVESMEIVMEKPPSKISTPKNLITLTEQIKDDWDIDLLEATADIVDDTTASKGSSPSELSAIELTETSAKKNEVGSSSAIITPIDTVTLGDLPTCHNSKMFAVKVKGTEDPTQLSKLVDLCKNNPLFKNKNVKFKIVPVKGPLPAALKDSQSLGGIDKAIIVQRTPTPPTRTSPKSPANVTKPSPKKIPVKNNKVSSISGPPIQDTKGPWECAACGKPSPLEFDTYYEFRLHFKDVHNQGVNPIYCQYCGYKSLKRNMQIYHLYTKHNIEPPLSYQFPKCPTCNYRAVNDYFMQKHMSTQHAGEVVEYICSCKMAFKTSELLQQHMVSNDCKKSSSYTCGYCRSIFDRFVNLKAHMRVCMKERSKPNLQSANPENGTYGTARGLESD